MESKKKYRVLVRLKPGVLDVQGKAVQKSLEQNGYQGISGLRIGKVVEFELESNTDGANHEAVREICSRALANTVIEDFEVIELS